jgi:serine/threonine protein kinase/ketosteroid isomerase-like protein
MKLCPVCQRCFEDQLDRCLNDQTELMVARPGECLIDGKYRLERLLARGGMGAVYAGTHLNLDRPIAVKMLLPAFIIDEEALQRFRREALTAARVSHPNLAEVYDYSSLPNGEAYIVMELVDGSNLRELMQDPNALSIEEIVSIARQLAEGVSAAHAAGVVHRDLKPSNILLTRDSQNGWRVKIADFGIAKFVEQTAANERTLTATGSIVGTPRYMSPEQCLGEPLDIRSDIYSLGIILYEMLAGKPPFDAASGTALGLKHIYESPRPIKELRPNVPEPLALLVMQALQKNPSMRPQTADEVAGRLLEIERALPHAGAADGVGPTDTPLIVNIPPAPTFVDRLNSSEPILPAQELTEPLTPLGAPAISTEIFKQDSGRGGEVIQDNTPTFAGGSTPSRLSSHPAPGVEVYSHKSGTDLVAGPHQWSHRSLLFATVVLTALALGIGYWFYSRNSPSQLQEGVTTNSTAEPLSKPSPRPKQSPTVTPDPAAQEADRLSLGASLNDWIAATNAGDIDRHMTFYMPTVDSFYRTRNVGREAVRAEKVRVFGEANSVDVTATEPVITFSPDGKTAVMLFRKRYLIEGPEERQGEVVQELRWRKTEEGWKITSERDLKAIK